MPAKGKISTNPISGDFYEYLETAKDTDGERVTMKATIKTTTPYQINWEIIIRFELYEQGKLQAIRTQEQYNDSLVKADALMEADPAPTSKNGKILRNIGCIA